MKITKQEATSQPVTIVLESQEEVDQMFALANCVSVRRNFNITFPLFDCLEPLQKEGELYSLEGSSLVKQEG